MFAGMFALAAFAAASDGETHRACLKRLTTQLEVSGDAASDVARAIVEGCIRAEPEAMDGMSEADRKRINELVRVQLREIMTYRVVRLRACRKTPGCDSKALTYPN